MRDDIAVNAHFGRTQGIDVDSALAVAIDYTYSVPEGSAGLAGTIVALLCLVTGRSVLGRGIAEFCAAGHRVPTECSGNGSGSRRAA